jgi:hypothetical protein
MPTFRLGNVKAMDESRMFWFRFVVREIDIPILEKPVL